MLVVLLLAGGCTKRADAQVRSAWEGANPQTRSEAPKTSGPDQPHSAPGIPATNVRGWTRVDQLLAHAERVLATSPDAQFLADLAKQWCEVEPRALPTRDPRYGDVRVCYLSPPVFVGGHPLQLELTGDGVIGLVLTDLTERNSKELSKRALKAVQALCERPWQPTLEHDFQICPTRGGSTLAIGRLPSDKRGSAWQVSIAVLGAS